MSDHPAAPGVPSVMTDSDDVASAPPVSTHVNQSLPMVTNSRVLPNAPAPAPPPPPSGGDPQSHRPPGTPSSFPSFSSFRLQPRVGTAVATPSPSFGSSRGRKRTAQCMGSPPPAAALSKDLFRDSPIGGIASLQPRPFGSNQACSSPTTNNGREQWCLSPPSIGRNSPRVESAMRSLSIKSPRLSGSPDNNHVLSTPPMHPNRTPIRAPGSSFSVYTPSPMASNHRRAGSTGSFGPASGKLSCSSPSSTSKSSPKLAPLTLIHQQDGKDLETLTPKKLPPRHMGPPSMLLSINSRHSRNGRDDVADDEMLLATPTATVPMVASSTMMSSSPKRPRDPKTPPQQVCLRSVFSRNSTSNPSPGSSTPGSSHHRSPRTPLPRVTLTPRRTPNRPGMPSPIQDLGLLPCNISLSRRPMSNEMSNVSPFARKRAPESPLERCFAPWQPTSEHAGKRCPATDGAADTTKAEPKAGATLPDYRKQNSYMPMQDWYCNSPPKNETFGSREHPSIPTSVGGIRSSNNSHNMSSDGRSISSCGTPEVKTRSLLAPSKNDDMMRAMANEFAPSIDDDSLTDEDEPFLLCDPAALVEERKSSSRSRQRPRLSYTSLDPVAGACQSSTPLGSGVANASNTSLLGMNFLGSRGDSVTSMSQREFTSPSGNSKPPKRERPQQMELLCPTSMDVAVSAPEESGGGGGQGQNLLSEGGDGGGGGGDNLSRLRSVESFGSIGLPLEAPADNARGDTAGTNRDLVTPPPSMPQTSASPPPLSSDKDPFTERAPSASVCIARSDPASVNFAISKMVFQTFQNHSPGMECSG